MFYFAWVLMEDGMVTLPPKGFFFYLAPGQWGLTDCMLWKSDKGPAFV